MTTNQNRPTSYRWVICSLLFFATTINYLDRQVLSLTWGDFIRPEFHWTNAHYGLVTGIFSLVYAIGMLFAGRIVDKLDTKKGYMWSIFIWSIGACVHSLCGVVTEWAVGLPDAEALRAAIEKLPQRERQVIALRYYHGMTQANCARVMHVSQVQISRVERRAVELLRENLM